MSLPTAPSRRRRLRRLLRRVALLLSVAAIIAAVWLFTTASVSVTDHGAHELINGRDDASALLPALGLLLLGVAGLAGLLG